MGNIDSKLSAVLSAGYELFWYGAASTDEIGKLEALLDMKLPQSCSEFLRDYGGGGVVGAEISGILNNDADSIATGTILGDTKACRSRYDLPKDMAVIYFHDDEICWCIDGRRQGDSAGAIVSYSLARRDIDRKVAADFGDFLQLHFDLYSRPA